MKSWNVPEWLPVWELHYETVLPVYCHTLLYEKICIKMSRKIVGPAWPPQRELTLDLTGRGLPAGGSILITYVLPTRESRGHSTCEKCIAARRSWPVTGACVPLLPLVLVGNLSFIICSVNKWIKINLCSCPFLYSSFAFIITLLYIILGSGNACSTERGFCAGRIHAAILFVITSYIPRARLCMVYHAGLRAEEGRYNINFGAVFTVVHSSDSVFANVLLLTQRPSTKSAANGKSVGCGN